MARLSVRLLISLAYLLALFAGAAWLYARMQRFEGRIALLPGAPERTVLRPAGSGVPWAASARNLPLDAHGLRDPVQTGRLLGGDGLFDAALLPGAIVLERIEVLEQPPPAETLHIAGPGRNGRYDAVPGAAFSFNGRWFAVIGARPWSGIVRQPGGQPLAAVSLRDGGGAWGEGIPIADGAWAYAGNRIAIGFRWCAGPAAAARMPEARPGLDAARWGVREGGRMHWFDGATPGSSIALDDGATVSLVGFDPARSIGGAAAPAIQLERRTAAAAETVWVAANGPREAPYRFEHPGAMPVVVLLQAALDGTAYAGVWDVHGARAAVVLREDEGTPVPLRFDAAAGADAAAPGGEWLLRLDQCMAEAVAVPRADPPVYELIVQTAALPGPGGGPGAGRGLIRLREGEAVTWREHRLRYRRIPAPPRCRYHLAGRAGAGAGPERFALEAGQTRRIGDWVFALAPDQPGAGRAAVLEARRTLGSPARLLGAAAFLAGAIGLTLGRQFHLARRTARGGT